jgi:predicted RNase H-like HicB family nuclease
LRCKQCFRLVTLRGLDFLAYRVPFSFSKKLPFGVCLSSRWYNNNMRTTQTYTAIIEQDTATGFYVAYVPDLPGAHTQAETFEELQKNLQEVISLVLEENPQQTSESHFVGTQLITV